MSFAFTATSKLPTGLSTIVGRINGLIDVIARGIGENYDSYEFLQYGDAVDALEE